MPGKASAGLVYSRICTWLNPVAIQLLSGNKGLFEEAVYNLEKQQNALTLKCHLSAIEWCGHTECVCCVGVREGNCVAIDSLLCDTMTQERYCTVREYNAQMSEYISQKYQHQILTREGTNRVCEREMEWKGDRVKNSERVEENTIEGKREGGSLRG